MQQNDSIKLPVNRPPAWGPKSTTAWNDHFPVVGTTNIHKPIVQQEEEGLFSKKEILEVLRGPDSKNHAKGGEGVFANPFLLYIFGNLYVLLRKIQNISVPKLFYHGLVVPPSGKVKTHFSEKMPHFKNKIYQNWPLLTSYY